MKIVMVSGKFDPPHDGHITHIVEASTLGSYLLVVVQPDEGVVCKKGRCEVPLWARVILLRGVLLYYGIEGDVVVGDDKDGRSVVSLQHHKPNIFAKGGDRTPDNMPKDEVEVCEKIGCKIVYGVSGQLNSSSKMIIDKEDE